MDGQGDRQKLGTCSACGGIVSKLAKTCPHCGMPFEKDGDILDGVKRDGWDPEAYKRSKLDEYENRAKQATPVQQPARGGNGKTSGFTIMIAVAFGIILALYLILKAGDPQVVAFVQELKK